MVDGIQIAFEAFSSTKPMLASGSLEYAANLAHSKLKFLQLLIAASGRCPKPDMKSKQRAQRNRQHEYLLSGHIRGGQCQSSMSGGAFYPDGKRYQYYICNLSGNPKFHGTSCDLPSFRVELVDSTVWNWIYYVMFDPETWENGWRAYQVEQELANKPSRERIHIVDQLLIEHREKYRRLVDLYVSGDIARELLIEEKLQLESAIRALQQEKEELSGTLETNFLAEVNYQRCKSRMQKWPMN